MFDGRNSITIDIKAISSLFSLNTQTIGLKIKFVIVTYNFPSLNYTVVILVDLFSSVIHFLNFI